MKNNTSAARKTAPPYRSPSIKNNTKINRKSVNVRELIRVVDADDSDWQGDFGPFLYQTNNSLRETDHTSGVIHNNA